MAKESRLLIEQLGKVIKEPAQVAAQIAASGRQQLTRITRVVNCGSSSLPPHSRAGGTVGHGYKQPLGVARPIAEKYPNPIH